MKNTYLILLISLAFCVKSISQVCLPQGISTNPENPVNPNPPTDAPWHWLNEFEWYANDGTTLAAIAIHDMLSTFGDIEFMISPFAYENSFPSPPNYPYNELVSADIDKLDMYPKDGWELISVNLGAYPNGELLTDQVPPQISAFRELPYILLYNKNRGILRLFANSLTGLSSPFDNVSVTISFAEPSKVSGLLRHNGKYDLAMDKETMVKSIMTTLRHPNNPSKWMYADFQLGYDPCTCLFRSDFRIDFKFVKKLELNMVANSISTEIISVDTNGIQTIPEDYLASVQYNEGFEGAGIFIYNNMNRMIREYIDRLEEVEAHNAAVAENQAKIKKKKYVLKALDFVISNGFDLIVTDELADSVAKWAGHIIQEIGIDGVTLDGLKLKEEGKKLLGEGFDWFSKEWIGEEQSVIPAPNPPTAILTSTTFNGTIETKVDYPGPILFNPGTYPGAFDNPAISAHNYPVYNEVLGLTALLNSPKLFYDKVPVSSSVENTNYNVWYNNAVLGYGVDFKSDIRRKGGFKFWLAEPLKLVFNPAANIDISNVSVQASFVLSGEVIRLFAISSGFFSLVV